MLYVVRASIVSGPLELRGRGREVGRAGVAAVRDRERLAVRAGARGAPERLTLSVENVAVVALTPDAVKTAAIAIAAVTSATAAATAMMSVLRM